MLGKAYNKKLRNTWRTNWELRGNTGIGNKTSTPQKSSSHPVFNIGTSIYISTFARNFTKSKGKPFIHIPKSQLPKVNKILKTLKKRFESRFVA
jgi:hypothetical protein